MALSAFQRDVCRLLAAHRTRQGDSYVAGTRLSRDVDVFHDTLEALEVTWQADRALLEKNGYSFDVLRERSGFVEAVIGKGSERVEIQWARDSAFRFFPLLPHPDFGLTLHPFDLASNKILALVGRVEVRDWIDTLTCHEKVAPLGLLAWAACGKDEDWNPQLIVDEAARTSHYCREEILELDWNGTPPDFMRLKNQWRQALSEARTYIETLPPEEAVHAILNDQGAPFQGDLNQLRTNLEKGALRFHAGHIGGAWPQFRPL